MSKICTIEKVSREWKTWDGKECSFNGYEVTVPTEMGSKTVSVKTIQEAFGIVGRYDNEADYIDKRADELAKYLTSDEGAWGRSGT